MKKFAVISLVCSLFLVGCSSTPSGGQTDDEALAIAKCIDDKGAKMYGAFWCPHCADQKKMFGKEAEKYMPYNECDARGENPVTEECLTLDVKSYPTWIFADNSRLVGAIPLTELQEKTDCSAEELKNYM